MYLYTDIYSNKETTNPNYLNDDNNKPLLCNSTIFFPELKVLKLHFKQFTLNIQIPY